VSLPVGERKGKEAKVSGESLTGITACWRVFIQRTEYLKKRELRLRRILRRTPMVRKKESKGEDGWRTNYLRRGLLSLENHGKAKIQHEDLGISKCLSFGEEEKVKREVRRN